MSRACCSWRVALTKTEPPAPTPPPALPWLLLPKVDGEHGLTFSCALSGWRRTHPFFLPHAPRCASYFGSYDGAWLFLAVDGHGPRGLDHVLVNLNNFEYIDLPSAIFHFDCMDPENVDIVAATLSRAPTEQGCIVAGIINSFLSHHQIAFWPMGDRLTDRVFSEAEQTVWLSPLEQVEDLLYLDEDFLFLTKEEHIRVCPELTIFHESPERILWRFQPRRRRDDDEEEEQVLARYLMESRGSLLMIVRQASWRRQNLPTSEVRVTAGDQRQASWMRRCPGSRRRVASCSHRRRRVASCSRCCHRRVVNRPDDLLPTRPGLPERRDVRERWERRGERGSG
uniref:KIB1-4 beta-propeller domain-containing protein n=1 Tax=Oryza rufipogon TaxID=4529 RepID=A0A0E0QXI9_ORYRU